MVYMNTNVTRGTGEFVITATGMATEVGNISGMLQEEQADKTGTLTLNQMTAVQIVAVGRRYAVEGKGYSTAGRINRVGGQADVPLDEFLVPMVLASDAVVRDGELIGDPTEGALVVLAAKGGIDAVSTRAQYPRIAELPFDAAYKLMATFHKMTDASGKEVIRCFVKGAPGWSCSPWSASSTRPGLPPGHRSRRRRRPASGSG
jgi:magnesium-transporting ATPase (P-type)